MKIQLAKKEEAQVFATDAILATLMCCTRSVQSWDILVHRIGKSTVFFDKREKSNFGLLYFRLIFKLYFQSLFHSFH